MSAWLAATPVLVPLLSAVLTALAAPHRRMQQATSMAGIVVLLACAVWLVLLAGNDAPASTVFGGWALPYGIAFAVDRLSAALVLVTVLAAAASLLLMAGRADGESRHPMQLPLMHGLIAGMGGVYCTADLFNLYVWFEVMLICVLGLFATGGRLDQLDAAFKYLVLQLLATLLLLTGVATVYASTGHLGYTALRELPSLPLATTVLAALTIAILTKSAAFPLFSWLPATYHALPAPVLAFVGGVATKLGIYALLRTLGDVFTPAPAVLLETLGWIAAATMLFGVLGAAYHWDLRRILAVHVVSQIGYVLLGVALAGEAGATATLVYAVHIILVKTNLFLLAAVVRRQTGSYDLRRIGGLYAARPLLAVMFLLSALALVGVPPLSGFWAKLLLLRETIGAGRYVWTAVALLVSVLTLYSMLKIWMEAFWKPHPQAGWTPPRARYGTAWAACGLLSAAMLAMSLWPQPVIDYAQAAARTLGAP